MPPCRPRPEALAWLKLPRVAAPRAERALQAARRRRARRQTAVARPPPSQKPRLAGQASCAPPTTPGAASLRALLPSSTPPALEAGAESRPQQLRRALVAARRDEAQRRASVERHSRGVRLGMQQRCHHIRLAQRLWAGRGHVQRRAALAVGRVHRGSCAQQGPHNAGVAVVSGAMQGRDAVLVGSVQVRFVPDQHVHEFGIAHDASTQQRRHPLVVRLVDTAPLGADARALAQDLQHDLQVRRAHAQQQRKRPLARSDPCRGLAPRKHIRRLADVLAAIVIRGRSDLSITLVIR
mmetsp:Transcript_87192/g.266815  ORF Transcript_87192/g.266815 Transcript_87192/m.266815 type:complete len:295 (-) Transcript_87192:445-1329(-)